MACNKHLICNRSNLYKHVPQDNTWPTGLSYHDWNRQTTFTALYLSHDLKPITSKYHPKLNLIINQPYQQRDIHTNKLSHNWVSTLNDLEPIDKSMQHTTPINRQWIHYNITSLIWDRSTKQHLTYNRSNNTWPVTSPQISQCIHPVIITGKHICEHKNPGYCPKHAYMAGAGFLTKGP